MSNQNLVQVALDKDLVKKMLDGLHSGAEGRALKVVIAADGRYHVTSKGLSIILEINSAGTAVKSIQVANDKLYAILDEEWLTDTNLLTYANSVYGVLRNKYSPYFHSLADNIVVFSRAYHNPAIDEH